MQFDDEYIFKKYYKALCYFAWEMVGDTTIAEDLVQDAYIAYLDNRSKISSASNAIRSFLYSAIRNAVYNRNRKSKTIQRYFERTPLQEIDDVDYNHEIIRAEFMSEIARIVERLPDSCQHVFKLSYFDGLSDQEISDKLVISVKRSVVLESGSDATFKVDLVLKMC